MVSRKSPLRDRLLSNSPDPLKSSILRESGMGWNPSSGSTDSVTSPLRIAKRDSPKPRGPVLARRSSSSYRHVHTNNLVSKSPFKSQIPTPSTPSSRPTPIALPTRRVSGEKRPRPSSMHEQAETENDRPFALKRERKQSKTFRELIQKEPVTKSPFKNVQPGSQPESLPSPPPITSSHDSPRATSTSPANFHMHVPAAVPNTQPSPRSALVSRTMHGPRPSGGPKRNRRKTVTFYERCDVLEYDRESASEEDDAFRSCDDGERNDDDEECEVPLAIDSDPSFNQDSLHEQDELMEQERSYESIDLSFAELHPAVPSLLSDPDTSITGIVDEMFANAKPSALSDDADGPITPPRLHELPTDLETEDGVPFGRSHHVERFLQHHRQAPPRQFSPRDSPRHSPSVNLYNLPTHALPHGPPATPPRCSSIVRHSTPPLGGLTHQDRIRQGQERDSGEEETLTRDVDNLPASPSLMQKEPSVAPLEEGLIPSFNLKPADIPESSSDLSGMMYIDPFAPLLQDEPTPSQLDSQNSDVSEDSMDPANLSVGNSNPDISGIGSKTSRQETNLKVPGEVTKSKEELRQGSPALSIFPSALSPRFDSPASRSASPLLGLRNEAPAHSSSPGRERISRDEVQRRLANQRQLNNSSPAQALVSSINNPPSTPIEESRRPSRESPTDTGDKEQNRLSTQTDFSTETAIVQTAEKKTLSLSTLAPSCGKELGLLGSPQLEMDFGSKFSLGGFGPTLHAETKSTDLRSSLEADKVIPKTEIYECNSSGIKMGDVDVDMDMKSALDRLMDDVAGAGGRPDDSMMTDEFDESFDRSQSMTREDSPIPPSARPKVLERAATDSALLQQSESVESRNVSGTSTIMEVPPPVPPKDNRTLREQLILQSRRRTRARETEGDESDAISRPNLDRQSLGYGRPSRRRSMSTGDAEVLAGAAKKRGEALLDIVSKTDQDDDPLADSIEKALRKLAEASSDQKKGRYHVREREGTIYASSSDEKISHMAGAGDLDAGRAWRMVRRPSDMNEYAKQIKEYRAHDKSKAYGKVFVKVVAIKGLNLPIPAEHTAITCTLNNGIHFVTTPECDLSRECRINQEFELIEHSKLEFTLTFKVRRDPHIIAQYKALTPVAPVPTTAPAPAPAPPPMIPSKSYGMRSFFSSSPKKSSKEKMAPPPPPPPQLPPQPQIQPIRLIENLARHLKPDGTLARAFIKFKDVAGRCDTRLFESSYPLIGQRVEGGGKYSTLEVGGVVLQMFRLPPLPGLPQDQLPQSLDECHRGLRHINWHKVTYFQGTLTQNGGDCRTWRRRQLRITGSNLIAFNDVTKRATATIDLKKAFAVEDNEESRRSPDEYDGLYGVERSFRLIFPQNQEIIFFADTEEEKAKWLEVLRALVGHIPPYPLWGELLWQRQEEIAKRMQAAQQTISQPQPQS